MHIYRKASFKSENISTKNRCVTICVSRIHIRGASGCKEGHINDGERHFSAVRSAVSIRMLQAVMTSLLGCASIRSSERTAEVRSDRERCEFRAEQCRKAERIFGIVKLKRTGGVCLSPNIKFDACTVFVRRGGGGGGLSGILHQSAHG